MTLDFNLKSAPDARCPMCRALLLGMSGKHGFRLFPVKRVRFDLCSAGMEHAITCYPPPAVQQFTATFVPCGCKWEARVGSREVQMYVLYIVHTEAGPVFEFGHRQHDDRYSLYIMTNERT